MAGNVGMSKKGRPKRLVLEQKRDRLWPYLEKMALQSPGSKLALSHKHDWLILLLLAAIDGVLNMIEPFHRYVGKDMMTNLMFPFKEDTIPMWAVPILSIFIPILIFVAFYFVRRDIYDLHHAILGLMFASLITGVITDAIKDAVGRPRPNFFERCFPDKKPVFDKDTGDVLCTGIKAVIKEGYKSFPSGHTSWSFAGLGFLSWYLSGKIRVFDRRGHIGKLCLVLLPLLIAALVGVTRVDDYWHHWTDVFAGGLIGIIVSSICYLLLFPFPTYPDGWAPYVFFHMMGESECTSQRGSRTPHVGRLDEMSLRMETWKDGQDISDC
ncbi:lipid phosphate phosphatase 2-like isoform X2 [Gastrolobium bilobum]|uniref:lipid phosphate phosphatase 2-like isoform X2 n=1 Tax=Gastrolobium bilobum TaxID=150636 RepID=UPI002AAF1FBA|nr:lipid phosphate phosphatase 2-like isoform X2 [Gastrolobium bilobum]